MLEHGHGAQENQVKESFISRKQGDKGKTELESVRETILSKTGGKEIKPAVVSELERVSTRILNKGGGEKISQDSQRVSQESQRVRKIEEGIKVGNSLNDLVSAKKRSQSRSHGVIQGGQGGRSARWRTGGRGCSWSQRYTTQSETEIRTRHGLEFYSKNKD